MRNCKIITCISTVAGNGAKYTATIMAHELAKQNPKSKIALVDLDLLNPYLFAKQTLNDRVHGIDNILDKISSEIITESMFRANMISIEKNLDLLKGTRKVGRENMVTRPHISKIVEMLKAIYDYVIMVVPSKSNNAAMTFGLFYSDAIVMVTRPNFANLLNIEESIEYCKTLRNSKDVPIYLMYNMRGPKDDLDAFTKYIVENNIQALGYMVYEPDTVDNQNLGGNVISDVAKKFSKLSKRGGESNTERIRGALKIMLNLNDEESDN